MGAVRPRPDRREPQVPSWEKALLRLRDRGPMRVRAQRRVDPTRVHSGPAGPAVRRRRRLREAESAKRRQRESRVLRPQQVRRQQVRRQQVRRREKPLVRRGVHPPT
ncbi:hypothetical protein [Nocardia bovistercoris]|uniref:Uncharacterized protein n=1 Tax=Nocardia bovistercoris TaxID=2785916 RepID=A0A931N3V2_9NOCA|nr:hypothetical protein [Nocardia bovistercoris]MBH0778117.1 hypothetical protein [Nocardia bovistercoris]